MKQFLIKTEKWNRLKSTQKDFEINQQNVEDSCKIDELLSLFHDYENERSDLRNGKKAFFYHSSGFNIQIDCGLFLI